MRVLVVLLSVLTLTPPQLAGATEPGVLGVDPATVAVEAYTYSYPLVLMDLTRRQFSNVGPDSGDNRGPMNTFVHMRAYPSADDREVVRPNFDTLYSLAWLDLTSGPIILSVPDTQGRYYMLPMLDMWTDVFANPGARTTGTEAGHFAIARQGWSGELPEGVRRIDAPTSYVWILGRTQTNGPADYEAVHAVQDGYTLTPLSQWGNEAVEVPASYDPDLDMATPPMAQIAALTGEELFTYAADLMGRHPVHSTDHDIVARMATIGLVPGEPFDASGLSAEVRQAIEAVPAIALARMQANLNIIGDIQNGWLISTSGMGVYGNDYFKRAVIALIGLGANPAEDALYPVAVADAHGEPLTGDHRYVLHFDADQLPPARAFWSVTMYDAAGYQVANELNRFAIGDRDALTFNDDGSLDLFLQHDNPGPNKVSNWLPAPASGGLGVTMRLYAPAPEALTGAWLPPAVQRAP